MSTITVTAFRKQILSQPLDNLKAIDQCWRTVIGIGVVPACIALYFRLTIPETPRYTMDIERNIKQASQDVDTYLSSGTYAVDPQHSERAALPEASWSDFFSHFSKWGNFRVLLGTMYNWFALDIAFYGLGLNSAIILKTIGFGSYSGDKHAPMGLQMYQTLRERAPPAMAPSYFLTP